MRIHSKAVSDKFDDEIVVVSLETGFYYSFRKTAMKVWEFIELGLSSNQIISKFNLSHDQENQILDFLDQLKIEKLIEDDMNNVTDNKEAGKLDFEDLEFTKFEDMSDLIMIDPIHDTDQEKGWPNKA